MSEVNVTYLTWDEVPEEIMEEYYDRALHKLVDSAHIPHTDEVYEDGGRYADFIWEVAQDIWENENGR
jgi:hypothetical protein